MLDNLIRELEFATYVSCSGAKGKDTVRVDATHGGQAKWICQNVYTMGEEGVDACPDGYEKITEEVACGTAAGYLGLTYAPEFNSGLCNLCGGCSGERDRL